ncbi:MAG: 3-dehydroquinate synthase [Phycisphaerales bacterium]
MAAVRSARAGGPAAAVVAPPSEASTATGDRVHVEFAHRVHFTVDALDPANPVLENVLAAEVDAAVAEPARCIVVVDAGVVAADAPGAAGRPLLDRVRARIAAMPTVLHLVADPIVVPGGEAAKQDRAVVDRVMKAINDFGICRRSYVLVVGGGAVLDAVGFAAATAHRGVRLIRFPTTTLAQDDAGIGVKNGINAFGKKNFIGAFAVPTGVINDRQFLATQSPRDLVAGVSEAVKVALLKDAAFFDAIETAAPAIARGDLDALWPVVIRSGELHLDHIVRGGDPFEMQIARPLDFGHWSAHRLEHLSDYAVRHGEAVSIGIAIDVDYAAAIGVLDADAADRMVRVLDTCGLPTRHPLLADPEPILQGLQEFREHLGGQLTITLVRGPGQPLDVHEIDIPVMRRVIAARGEGARS